MTARTLVVGLGNPFAGDDGVGPAVIEALRDLGLPPGLRAEIGDTDSLRLPSIWRAEPEVWLVDAARDGREPGARFVVEHEQLLTLPQRHASVHHLSLPENLRWLALTWPEMAVIRYRLFAVEPERMQPERGLSPAVARAVPEVARAILGAFAAT